MKTFDFCLYLTSDDVSEDDANRLYECGCDDALSGAAGGEGFVHFAREAESLEAAIRSAVADVRKAGFQVARVEIGDEGLAVLEQVSY